MSQKPERAQSVIGAHDDQSQSRKLGTKRRHLAVALSVTTAVEVNEHWTICIGSKLSGPDIQIETVFIALNVLKPSRRKLWAGRTEVDRFAGSLPLRRQLWRSPPQLARRRRCVRNA